MTNTINESRLDDLKDSRSVRANISLPVSSNDFDGSNPFLSLIKPAIEKALKPEDNSTKKVSAFTLTSKTDSQDHMRNYIRRQEIQYYRQEYNIEKNPIKLGEIIQHLLSLYNLNDTTNYKIEDIDQKIAEDGIIIFPQNIRRQRDCAKHFALQRIFNLKKRPDIAKTLNNIDFFEESYEEYDLSKKLWEDFYLIIYELVEFDNLESFNYDDIDLNPDLKQIVLSFLSYKQKNKIKNAECVIFRERLFRLMNQADDSKEAKNEQRILKILLAYHLGVDIEMILQITEKNKLKAYIDKQFKKYNITIPNPKNYIELDFRLNELITSYHLLAQDLIKIVSDDPNLVQSIYLIIMQLTIERRITPNLLTLMKECNVFMTEKVFQDDSIDHAIQAQLRRHMKVLVTQSNAIKTTLNTQMDLAASALESYIVHNRIPDNCPRSFAALLSTLDKFVDEKERYEKQADGTFASPIGLKKFRESFNKARNASYFEQQDVLSDFFDYVWTQLDAQQRHDLQLFNTNYPSQGLQINQYVREGKKQLNHFAREFGLSNRGVKRIHPVEQLHTQINKLINLLPEEDAPAYMQERNRIIGNQHVKTIRHLPDQKLYNFTGEVFNSKEQIDNLSQLKRTIQSALNKISPEDRLLNSIINMLKMLHVISHDAEDKTFQHLSSLVQLGHQEFLALSEELKKPKRDKGLIIQDLQSLHAKIYAHAVASNIPLAIMNPLGHLEPTVSSYRLTKKRRTISHLKQAYHQEKQNIKTSNQWKAMLYMLGQVGLVIMGAGVFPQFMPLYIAWGLTVAAVSSSAWTNYNYVAGPGLSISSRFSIFGDWTLGYKSPMGKLFVGFLYSLALAWSLTFAAVVGTSFMISLPVLTPAVIAGLSAYALFASVSTLVTFELMTKFMTFQAVRLFDTLFQVLSTWFPEIADANNVANVLGKSLGFKGFMRSLGKGLLRVGTSPGGIIDELLAPFKNFFFNPTGNPSSTAGERFYKRLELLLNIPFMTVVLGISGYLCYLSCVSTIAFWGTTFTSILVGAGLPVATAAMATFIIVGVLANTMNILFCANTFWFGAIDLASVLSQTTVALTVKLPVEASKLSLKLLERTLNFKLLTEDLFGKTGIITQAWQQPGKTWFTFKINVSQAITASFGRIFEAVTIGFNALGFASAAGISSLNSGTPPNQVAVELTSNSANSIYSNGAGAKDRLANVLTGNIPQAARVIDDYTKQPVRIHVTPLQPSHAPEDESEPVKDKQNSFQVSPKQVTTFFAKRFSKYHPETNIAEVLLDKRNIDRVPTQSLINL